MDLRAVCYGPQALGARRLLALVEQLPPEAVSHDQPEWTVERELAAQQLEATAEVVRMLVVLVRMWVDPKHRDRIKVPEQFHVQRPHEVEQLHRLETPGRRAPAAPAADEWPPRLNVKSGREFARRLVG